MNKKELNQDEAQFMIDWVNSLDHTYPSKLSQNSEVKIIYEKTEKLRTNLWKKRLAQSKKWNITFNKKRDRILNEIE